MVQRSNDALLKDAQIMLKREECALDTVQRKNISDAAVQDAQIKLSKEECALSMVQK